MQFERGATALVVLSSNQALVQSKVLGARNLKCFGQRVEPVGDGRQFARFNPWKPDPIVALLEVRQTAGQSGEWIEDAAKQEIKNGDHRRVYEQPYETNRHDTLPDLGDLIARL